MNPYLDHGDAQLYHGDCRRVLAELADASIDVVLTDPPYGLEFMGRDWDAHPTPGAFQAWCESWARELLRVLKPGGHLAAFGGTRTSHRLASGIEDAGFEIRDTLCWLYGSGFPKSLDVSKAIDAAAGAERDVIRRHVQSAHDRTPGHTLRGSQDGSLAWQHDVTAPATPAAQAWQGWGTALKPAHEPILLARKPLTGTVAANVLAHGTGALHIDACRIAGTVQRAAGSTAAFRGAEDGYTPGQGREYTDAGRWPANVVLDDHAASLLDQQTGELHNAGNKTLALPTPAGAHDRGGASRFFYTAKAARAERNLHGADNTHPTVKPLDLMRWLVRLLTPPGGLVLDPFAGSGTTLLAARTEGHRSIGIDQSLEYLEIARRRLAQGSLLTGDTTPLVHALEDAETADPDLSVWLDEQNTEGAA